MTETKKKNLREPIMALMIIWLFVAVVILNDKQGKPEPYQPQFCFTSNVVGAEFPDKYIAMGMDLRENAISK